MNPKSGRKLGLLLSPLVPCRPRSVTISRPVAVVAPSVVFVVRIGIRVRVRVRRATFKYCQSDDEDWSTNKEDDIEVDEGVNGEKEKEFPEN